MTKEIQINRPDPIESNIAVVPYIHESDPQIAIDQLLNNKYVLISDFFSTGLTIFDSIEKAMLR